MRLRLFHAATMAEAMARARAELGDDALILNSRRVADGVELTAALEDEPEPAPPDPARLAALTWHAVPAALHPALAHGDLAAALGRALPFSALPLAAHDPPILLAGPPGAGKTLTTVRLATRLVIAGATPVIISTDAKRAGASEQLAAFTRCLGVPLLVASQPVSLARALARRRDGAPVLIDTAGTDPWRPDETEELKHLAHAAGAHVVVVLPSGLDPNEANDLARAYVAAGAVSLAATRLDLARRLGGVIAAAAAGLNLTEAGIGPGAADGLVPMTPSFLAARLSSPESKSHDT
jgi:flagellar biosynthesis protein FlhF